MKIKHILSWVLRLVIAIIFLQTLFFKFTAHPDSVYIFSQLGIEPYGRIGVGIMELITSALILIPRTKLLGIFLSFGTIGGAIFSHFLVLGTEVKGDSGGLFSLALIVLAACIVLFVLYKNEFVLTLKNILKK